MGCSCVWLLGLSFSACDVLFCKNSFLCFCWLCGGLFLFSWKMEDKIYFWRQVKLLFVIFRERLPANVAYT